VREATCTSRPKRPRAMSSAPRTHSRIGRVTPRATAAASATASAKDAAIAASATASRRPARSRTAVATAVGAALFAWVFLVFFAGSADRAYVFLGLSYEAQLWVYRGLIWVVPPIVFFVTRRVCRELQRSEAIERERIRAEGEAAQVWTESAIRSGR